MSSILLKWAITADRKTDIGWDQIYSLARSVKGERGGGRTEERR